MRRSDETQQIIRETLARHMPGATEREVALLAASWEQRRIDDRRQWQAGWIIGALSMAAAVLGLLWLQR